ncbi:MAG TPA: patatin-like phospholipase family protein [Chthoniobacterales bacterium]|nr:patatin-like phospholipase family protein [Chthoniobacterales bacterium]
MSQFRSLVFEGGGVKGIAYAGALEELEKRGIVEDVTRIAGTSAGAISAALLALGATSDFVAEAVGGTNFRSFMDSSFGLVRDAKRVFSDYGWFKGDEFSEWMRKQVYALTDNPNLTFGQLWELVEKKKPGFKKLYVTGSNLSGQIPIVYSGKTADTPIWLGVRVSMSIPLFFAAIRDTNNSILVDGGVTWNYPLDIFDFKGFLSDPAGGVKPTYTQYDADHIYNKETLGLRVDTRDQIQAEKDGWKSPPRSVNNFVDYVACLVAYMGDMANRLHLHENDWHRTIFIDASGVGTTEFSLSDAKTQMLIENGRRGVVEYFKWFEDPNSKPINRI